MKKGRESCQGRVAYPSGEGGREACRPHQCQHKAVQGGKGGNGLAQTQKNVGGPAVLTSVNTKQLSSETAKKRSTGWL